MYSYMRGIHKQSSHAKITHATKKKQVLHIDKNQHTFCYYIALRYIKDRKQFPALKHNTFIYSIHHVFPSN